MWNLHVLRFAVEQINSAGTVLYKQALAQYTWVEQVDMILKGQQKKQEHFQVRLGPDAQPQKTSLDPPSDSGGQGGRLKRQIVEKSTETTRTKSRL